MKPVNSLLCTLSFIALPLALNAQVTVTWTGSQDNDGTIAANWDTGVRPTAADTIVIDTLPGNISPTINNFARSDATTNFSGTLDLKDGTLNGEVGNSTAGRVTGATYNIGDGVGAAQTAVYNGSAFQRDGGAVTVNILSDGFMNLTSNYNRRGGPSTTTTVDGGKLAIAGAYVQGFGSEADNFTIKNGGVVELGDGVNDEAQFRSGSMTIESSAQGNSSLTIQEMVSDNAGASYFNVIGGGSTISVNEIGGKGDGEGIVSFSLDTDGISAISVVQDFATGDFTVDRFISDWAIELKEVDGLGTYSDTDPIILFDFLDPGVDQTDLDAIASGLLWTDDGTIAGATVADGDEVTIGSNQFTVNYTDVVTTGGQITLTLVPEPSTFSFLAVTGILFLCIRRFKRRG